MDHGSVTVQVKIDIFIPSTWFDQVLGEDMFRTNYCGYWLRGVDYAADLGWLVWESDEKCTSGREPDRAEAVAAWPTDKTLPAHWFRFGRAEAILAYVQAVRRWGEGWQDGPHGDAAGIDAAVQLALLGEIRYG